MVSVQLGNNPTDELVQLLQLEDTKLHYAIDVTYDHDDMHYMGGGFAGSQGRQQMRLTLTYYINQHPSTPLQIFQSLETLIAEFLKDVNGVFTQRTMEPFRGEYVMTVMYSALIADYDNFIATLPELARKKADRDFTQALEIKLSED